MWFRWSRVVQRRPWPAAVIGFLALLTLAAPFLDIRFGFPDAGNDPESLTTRRAYDLVVDGFGAGVNGPLLLAAELPDQAAIADVQALADDLRPPRAWPR